MRLRPLKRRKAVKHHKVKPITHHHIKFKMSSNHYSGSFHGSTITNNADTSDSFNNISSSTSNIRDHSSNTEQHGYDTNEFANREHGNDTNEIAKYLFYIGYKKQLKKVKLDRIAIEDASFAAYAQTRSDKVPLDKVLHYAMNRLNYEQYQNVRPEHLLAKCMHCENKTVIYCGTCANYIGYDEASSIRVCGTCMNKTSYDTKGKEIPFVCRNFNPCTLDEAIIDQDSDHVKEAKAILDKIRTIREIGKTNLIDNKKVSNFVLSG